MKAVIKKAWEGLKDVCDQIDEDANVRFDEDRYSEFEHLFIRYYELFLDKFMTERTTELDEHKQTAVIIISAIQANVILQSTKEGEIALAPYAVALKVGLSFLLDRINEKLRNCKDKLRMTDNQGNEVKINIDDFYLPYPLACDTPYFESLCRILYFENGGAEKEGIGYPMEYNIVEWADRFFLLEFILLQQNGINPWLLRETISNNK